MFNVLFFIAAGLEIVFVPIFLKHYWPQKCKKSFMYKTVCSALFVLCGIFAVKATGNNTLFADYMVMGLVLGMVGDLLLHALTKKLWPFALGVIAFLAGHVFYIMALQKAIYVRYPGSGFLKWYEAAIVAAILALAVIYCIKKDLFRKKGPLVGGILVYAVVLTLMLAKALRYVVGEIIYGVHDHMFMISLCIGLGSVLFVLSDTSLGYILANNSQTKRSVRIFNIVTYYLAQVLLAGSIFFVFSRELYS